MAWIMILLYIFLHNSRMYIPYEDRVIFMCMLHIVWEFLFGVNVKFH